MRFLASNSLQKKKSQTGKHQPKKRNERKNGYKDDSAKVTRFDPPSHHVHRG